ncbi:unnamed protein product [Diamesa serratosioi]
MKLVCSIVCLFLLVNSSTATTYGWLIDLLTGAISLKSSYDFIVVGAGSAGSVVANRLTENSTWKVLLAEAGAEENFIQDIPLLVQYLQGTSANWNDTSEPSNNYCLSMINSQCSLPHGKVMGGSSVLNYMIWTRGNPKDFDNWEALGNPGWNYTSVSKYFKKIENSTVVGRDAGFAGTAGPLPITFTPYRTGVANPFIQAGIALGGQQVDYNGAQQLGYSWIQSNMKGGIRFSANRAYIRPIDGKRPNLDIRRNSQVSKVLIDATTKKVTGVTLNLGGYLYNITATKEVVLSAGAINTPQILMLSGIGPKAHLESKNITSVVDLKVGNYLQDHVAPGGITILVNVTTITAAETVNIINIAMFLAGQGPLTSPGGVEGISYHDTNPSVNNGWTDMEFLQIGGSISGDIRFQKILNIMPATYQALYGNMIATNANGAMVYPMIMRPKSTGNVTLKTKNYLDRPSINPNYFSDAAKEDVRVAVFAIRKLQSIIAQPSMQAIGASLLSIPCPGLNSSTATTYGWFTDFLTGAWNLKASYDFIVVGAGSAGSVVANRLTENSTWKVLLAEAGAEENFIQDIPLLVQYLQETSANWNDTSDPSNNYCLSMINNQCSLPHGKVMGGSSVLNYMIWTRGNPKDFDNWEALGNPGWNYTSVSKYFKKIENSTVVGRDAGFAGTAGPLPITFTPYRTGVANPFIQAGIALGGQQVDYNGAQQLGYSWIQSNMKGGIRFSANKAYIRPIDGKRPNLDIRRNSQVSKVLIDATTKKVTGVTLNLGGYLYNITATKEVVLSAGAINTPQILMLSGIGPKAHLESKNITSVVDLKVGNYLQDHVAPGGLTILVNVTTLTAADSNIVNLALLALGKGPLTSPGGVEGISYHDTNPSVNNGWTDMEFLQIGGSISGDIRFQKILNIMPATYQALYGNMIATNANGAMVYPMIMRPKSTGNVTLKTKNYLDRPSINPNYFSDAAKEDVRVAVFAIRKLQSIIAQPSMQAIGASLLSIPCPGCESNTYDTDAYWECYMRHMTFTIWHYSGTAKMGPSTNPDAVVSPTLKVHGTTGLRVADNSIIPEIPSAHLNAIAMMIGEKASDLIKKDYGMATV